MLEVQFGADMQKFEVGDRIRYIYDEHGTSKFYYKSGYILAINQSYLEVIFDFNPTTKYSCFVTDVVRMCTPRRKND